MGEICPNEPEQVAKKDADGYVLFLPLGFLFVHASTTLDLICSERCWENLFVRGCLADDKLVAMVGVFSVLTVVMWGLIKEGGALECLALLRAFLSVLLVVAYVILFLIGIYKYDMLGDELI